MASLAFNFPLRWPNSILTLFSYFAAFSSVPDKVAALECEVIYITPSVPYIYLKNVVFAIVPVFLAGAFTLYWLVTHNPLARSSVGIKLGFVFQGKPGLHARAILSIWVMLFLLQSTVSKQAFQLFTCVRLNSNPNVYTTDERLFLLDDKSVQCWTDSHWAWTMSFGLFSMIVYAIGIPAMAFFFLRRNYSHLNEPRTMLKYGFLFDGFKEDSYYWEVVIMVRKLGMVTVTVFLRKFGPTVQAATALIWLIGSLVFQVRKMPYASDQLNKLEVAGLSVAVVTMYLGLLMFSTKFSSIMREVLTVLVIILNITWVAIILVALGSLLYKRFTPYFRRASSSEQQRNSSDADAATSNVTMSVNPMAVFNDAVVIREDDIDA